eukprot:6424552-Prymnesium_polylepis.1
MLRHPAGSCGALHARPRATANARRTERGEGSTPKAPRLSHTLVPLLCAMCVWDRFLDFGQGHAKGAGRCAWACCMCRVCSLAEL